MRILAVVIVLLAAGCSRGPQAPPFKPVADTKTLMADVVERQAQII